MYEKGQYVALRAAFGPALAQATQGRDDVFVVTADLGSSVGIGAFRDEHPNLYVNCGVAEQSMIGIAAGLASEGYLPFAVTFASFIGRSVDHIRQAVLHNRLKVIIVGSHGGVSNGMDGPSAHAIEDLGIMTSMPGLDVVAPSCANQLPNVIEALIKSPNAAYLRLYREPTPVYTDPGAAFTLGQPRKVLSGDRATVLAVGPHVALAHEWLRESSAQVDLFEVHTLTAPLPTEVLESVVRTGRLITLEDHFKRNGLSSVAQTALVSNGIQASYQSIALQGYARSGPYYELLDAIGIGREALLSAIV